MIGLSNNIAADRPIYISLKSQNGITHNYYKQLLAEPSIAIPTWEVLIDNNLSVRQKVTQLYEIGWEPEIIQPRGIGFCQLMMLARLLEKGIS